MLFGLLRFVDDAERYIVVSDRVRVSFWLRRSVGLGVPSTATSIRR